MSRFYSGNAVLLSVALLSACSDRNRSGEGAERQPALGAETVVQDDAAPAKQQADAGAASGFEEFAGYRERLEIMKAVKRQAGQTLLTGNTLVFDYQQRLVRMDGDVHVADDQGRLETESLVGRFSASNQVEYIEAKGDVQISSGGRTARASEAVYNFEEGTVQLDGQAVLTEAGNRLKGERIRFWTRGDRKMVCEPNALLVIEGRSQAGMEGMPEEIGETEIRANQIVYTEDRQRIDLLGRVRLRSEQLAMNCDKVYLHLKDNNEIDWIEAVSGVIIQSQERKALADRATYDADEGKFTLEGDPMVMQGRNVMTGDRITFWHETRGMVCEPNARVLLFLDEETKARFLEDLDD